MMRWGDRMNNAKIKDLVLISLFSAVIVICSLITIPSAIPFTLQTFAVFLCLNILGAKRGIISIIIYILLGIVGLPVFSGFNGGIGALFNVTGGFIFGFILSALVYWIITIIFRSKSGKAVNFIASFSGLLVCYMSGTVWYVLFFVNNGESISFISAITVCVLPFIIPDILKILLSITISERIKKHIK